MAGESARERARQVREKAERLQRVAQAWERGAEGESATARLLAGLPPEWTVLHDLRWPGRRFANIDHLVIGPGGVFVVDSKNWTGRVQVQDGVLRQNGRGRENAVAGCADAALAVAGLVPMYAAMVHPVLCFVRDDELRGWSSGVILCSSSTLLEMLVSRPSVLAPQGIEHLRRTLEAQIHSATSAPPAATRRPRGSRPAQRTSRSTRAASRAARRRRKAARELITALVVACVAIFWGPAIVGAAAPKLTDLFMDGVTPTPTECPTTKPARARAGAQCATPRPTKTPARKPKNAGDRQEAPRG